MHDKECKRFCGVCKQNHQRHNINYMSIYELLTGPDNIENASKISETFSIYKVTRSFSEDNVCFIDFFRVANDNDAFFTQFYRKDDDLEVCGHEILPLLFDVDQTCAFCKAKYVELKEKEHWLQYNLCEQWLHLSCFQK